MRCHSSPRTLSDSMGCLYSTGKLILPLLLLLPHPLSLFVLMEKLVSCTCFSAFVFLPRSLLMWVADFRGEAGLQAVWRQMPRSLSPHACTQFWVRDALKDSAALAAPRGFPFLFYCFAFHQILVAHTFFTPVL